ncbi:hypothetical protein [Clostridium sp. C8-1-8]|uniref:hypothetical protein n=1 Tax=Clostridium sp. C8-1-8 TaxID=2698831 RepID=UPI001370A865|nr:hypothetical protein [Clostridium sp. C8-1-8]
MEQNNSNNYIVKWIIFIVVAVGIAFFINKILENMEINFWIARVIGGAVIVIVAVLLYNLVIKNTKK